MRKLIVAVAALILPLLAQGQPNGPVLSRLRPVSPPSLARTAEFALGVSGDYSNPYDPDQIRVDARVSGPGGRSWTVPAFWMEPCAMREEPADDRFAGLTYVQFYIAGDRFPRDKPVSFAVSEMVLESSATGRRRDIAEWMRPKAWTCRGGTAVAQGTSANGKPALVVTIVPTGANYPGVHLVPSGDLADWSGFDTLEFQARPLAGLAEGSVTLELREGKAKHSTAVLKAGGRDAPWQTRIWKYGRRMPRISWAEPGKGEWRLRIAAPTTGDYSVAVTATDRNGTAEAQAQSFHLEQTSPDGFIRPAPGDSRYLCHDSGKPYFSVGTNLLVFNHDFAEYLYYIDRFTDVGVNLVRVWLNNPFGGWKDCLLGLEQKGLVQYGPQECARLDALLNHADRRGASLMLCQLDFREISEEKSNERGGWEKSPYAALCPSAGDFFSNEDVRRTFRKRLRYLVARWSASPAVHSWEFFNEINLTDAWKAGRTDEIRAWHAEMAEYVRGIDPYKHLLTTSISNPTDHPLWDDPWIELVQPHFYQTAAVDFASFLRGPCLEFARHGKPLLPGEFGLMTIKFQDVEEGGVSVHNGLWASVMSGCAGTGMPWWWDWIDRHDYYHHFRGVAAFAKTVPWHEQAFLPIPDADLGIALPNAAPGPPGPVALKLERHTWDAKQAYNRPARIEVRRDGTMEPAGSISTRLHGVRNHRDCHNPKAIVADWPVAGQFVVSVGDVSGWGGANLRITVDGKEALFRDFPDEDEELHNVMRRYRGDYAVEVTAGRHEIVIENTGRDWLVLDQIRLGNYGPPQVGLEAMGLRGKDMLLLWIRNRDYTWFGFRNGQTCAVIEGARIAVRGVPPGEYVARLFDPQEAAWLGEKPLRTSREDGDLKLHLPGIQHDLAIVIGRPPGR